ncbi:MAG: hypothetical protein KAG66_20190, partial [Methylococcales bacterium]|nr:hypothetical protein [Methylococcales bacterium]
SCDLNKAKENNLVGNKVWIYDDESYKEKGTDDDQLDPWGGFWVSALAGSNGYSLALSTSVGDEADVFMGTYDTPGRAVSVVLSSDGSKAYVADGDSGLQIVDVSNPEVPKLVSSYEARGSVRSVSLSNDGSKAYLAKREAGMEIIDISNPAAPKLLGNYNENEPGSGARGHVITRIALSSDGSKAYLADALRGLKILDISNPVAPTLLGFYEAPQTINDVTLSSDGGKAYLADGINGLRIIDVSNPTVPSELGQYDTHAKASTVTLSNDGSKAYMIENDAAGHGGIAAYGRGLFIVDISNSEAPALLGRYDTGRRGHSVALSSDGSKAYVPGGHGLKIVDITNPT